MDALVRSTVVVVVLTAVGVMLAGLPGVPVSAAGPLPAPITKPGVSAGVVDFVQVPASSGAKPLARINFMTHAGDGSAGCSLTTCAARFT